MDDCPVCFGVATVRVQPCRHAYCAECAERIMDRFGGRCAMCRGDVAGVDVANKRPPTCVLEVGKGVFAGVTLTNVHTGVRVVRLAPRDEGARHLRVGDVITHVNDVAAVHHRVAVSQIDAATRSNVPVRLCLRPRGVAALPWRARAVRTKRRETERFLAAFDTWTRGHANP